MEILTLHRLQIFLGKTGGVNISCPFFSRPCAFLLFFFLDSGTWKRQNGKSSGKRKNCGSNNFFMARMTYQHRSNFSIYFWDHVGKKAQTTNKQYQRRCMVFTMTYIYIYTSSFGIKKRKQHSWNLQNSPEKRKKQSSALKILVLIASRSGFPWSPGKSQVTW